MPLRRPSSGLAGRSHGPRVVGAGHRSRAAHTPGTMLESRSTSHCRTPALRDTRLPSRSQPSVLLDRRTHQPQRVVRTALRPRRDQSPTRRAYALMLFGDAQRPNRAGGHGESGSDDAFRGGVSSPARSRVSSSWSLRPDSRLLDVPARLGLIWGLTEGDHLEIVCSSHRRYSGIQSRSSRGAGIDSQGRPVMVWRRSAR